jgi:hypothetical protein
LLGFKQGNSKEKRFAEHFSLEFPYFLILGDFFGFSWLVSKNLENKEIDVSL